MSTIDQRVVEMRFDNKQFESGVATTMSTLEKFKQSLNLTGATKGLEEVGSATKRVDFSGLTNGIETVSTKFSYLQATIQHQLNRIVDSAVNAGKRMVSALTIDPVKTGFAEYETQINAVQTILANTKSKGTTLDDVNSALDELNTYADKTIYNFTEMTRNIGTFTAAGIDLDTSVSAIQGIANLAAVSGSTSQQASTAMYQLSQALASGTVKLMDWNSVVNAGMGGQVFQDALKKTSKELGTGADAAIKASGSFRESLHTGWLTAEVLTETLKKFTSSGATEYVAEYTGMSKEAVDATLASAKAQYGEADAIDKAAEALAKKSGKNKDEIKQALEFAQTAEDAATKVKTFSQLFDTLKEAAQSGWTQTWEIIVGDFEEAKALLTNISDVIGGFINDSAKARNELLQGWKDDGGRTDLIDGFKNAFDGLINIVKPIREAFRDIFPPTTVGQLVSFTKGFKGLTASFAEFTASHGDQIKSLFTGIFSVLDIGVSIIKAVASGIGKLFGSFAGYSGNILDAAASFGDWLTNLRKSVKETDIFRNAIEKATGFVTNIIDRIKEFGSSLKVSFKAPALESLVNLFKLIWDLTVQIGGAFVNVFSVLGKGLAEAFSNLDFNTAINAINGGLITGILLTVKNFTKGLFDTFNGEGGVLENIRGILDDVRGSLQAYQDDLKAGTLLKIAGAIGILAAAILVISTIDTNALTTSLYAITVLFGELMGSLAIFTQISTNMSGVVKGTTVMVGMSIALLILASAVKKLSSIDMVGIGKGLLAVGVLMAELGIFLNTAKFNGKMMGTATGVVILSASMLILANAVERFGEMDVEVLKQGLLTIGFVLAALSAFTLATGNAKHITSTGVAMVLLGASMKIFASAVKDFGSIPWEQLKTGLTGLATALAAVTIAVNFMPKNMISIGVGMVAVGAALKIVASAMKDFGGLSSDELKTSLIAMGVALLELGFALNMMNGTLAGSAALLVAAGALSVLAPALKSFGEMSLAEIGKSLLTMAGAFAVIGVAGALLAPVIPSILALSGAMLLFGLSITGIGAGIALLAVGFTGLSAALGTGATVIMAGLSVIVLGIANLIPTVCIQLANGIIAFAQVIADGVPTIALAVGVLLDAMLNLIVEYVPKIVNAGITLLLALLKGIADNIQQVVETAVDVVLNFIKGVANSLPKIIQAGIDLMISFINGMANGIRNNTQAVIDATNNLMDAIIGAVKAYFKNMVSQGKKIVLEMIDGVKSQYSDMKSAAKDMMEGFVKGVKEKFSSIKNAAVNAVKGAVDSVKSFLGINSPSKVFAEIGRYSDEGMVVGLTKYAGTVKNAATNVGKKAVDSMSNAVSGLSDIFGSDIETQPTIRPVLDLSNIQNGANSINGMFGQQQLALAGVNVGVSDSFRNILADVQSRGDSNSDIVEAIANLRGDFSGLVNAICNMKIEMDSGTVVGQLIGKIDSGLGQIAIHKGRLN